MKEIEGIILKLGTEDRSGRIYDKDCTINYSEKVTIEHGCDFYKQPGHVISNAKIIRDGDTLSFKGEIVDNCDSI